MTHQTFRDRQYPGPRLDPNGKPSSLLLSQYKGYCNKDPPPKQQKALPKCVLIQLYRHNKTEQSWAIADLCIILSTSSASTASFINIFCDENKTFEISGNNVVNSLRAAALTIGEGTVGFKHSDIGSHSIRSGAAMAMYLDKVPAYTIHEWSKTSVSLTFLIFTQQSQNRTIGLGTIGMTFRLDTIWVNKSLMLSTPYWVSHFVHNYTNIYILQNDD